MTKAIAVAKAANKRRIKVTLEHQETILRLKAEGQSISAIARTMKLSRPTLYSVLATARDAAEMAQESPIATDARAGQDDAGGVVPPEPPGPPETRQELAKVEIIETEATDETKAGVEALLEAPGIPQEEAETLADSPAVDAVEHAADAPLGNPPATLELIVSGGKAGVEIAARLVAEMFKIDTAGQGESASANLQAADATLWFGYTDDRTTLQACAELGRPCLRIDRQFHRPRDVARWIVTRGIKVLNVAGTPESREPGLGAWAERFLRTTLYELGFSPR